MTQWYLSFDGNQVGPMDLSAAIGKVRQNPNGFAWRDGYAEWQPIASIAELNPGSGGPVPTPPLPASPRVGADEIDFKIVGAEMQFVEVELDPGESAVAEAGAMMYKDSAIDMQTVFGDASAPSVGGGGFMDKLMGAG
ncbi:MAG: GYF domain-containing protein, partial [Desulfobacteraceae bacterium]|nr:GYF domain-containing protein [Desulfobacteraceae bacterium]